MEADVEGTAGNEVVAPRVSVNQRGRQLRPGTTLNDITSNLPRITFPFHRSGHFVQNGAVCMVSTATQTLVVLVHNAKVDTHSRETAIVLNPVLKGNYSESDDIGQPEADTTNAIALYSSRDKAFYHVPPIPLIDSGIPLNCQCIPLDGKIYVVGGTKTGTGNLGSQEVYVWDLAGQMQWNRCADMRDGRQEFGCGTVNGRIYVFGGTSLGQPLEASEVYDPTTDAWSAIRPKGDQRFNNDVTAVGEDLYVYCGQYYIADRRLDKYYSYGLKAYHPHQNTWSVVSSNILKDTKETNRFFIAHGKVYSMSRSKVYVYDIDNGTREELHSFSFPSIEQRRAKAGSPEFKVRTVNGVLPVDHELLAVVSIEGRVTVPAEQRLVSSEDSPRFIYFCSYTSWLKVSILVQSIGFNSGNKEIVWEEVSCPVSFEGGFPSPLKGILQL